MLISLKYEFLFVHIAKTGGTSVRAALAPLLWRDPLRWLQYACNRVSGLTGHKLGVKLPRHAKAVAALEMLPGDVFRSLYKFAFVRNPWDLQVSSYHHIQRERPHLLAGITSFDDFLAWKLEGERAYHYILDASTEPQWDSLIDLRGRCIVDFIGRYERLADDYQQACQNIGLPKIPALPHRRQTDRRRDYRRYYTDRSAELIAKHFAADIERFGYQFD